MDGQVLDTGAPCGMGTKYYYRECEPFQNYMPLSEYFCEGIANKTEPCDLGTCGGGCWCWCCWHDDTEFNLPSSFSVYAPWGQWGDCSHTCDVGTRVSERECLVLTGCEGVNMKSEPCPNVPPCPGETEKKEVCLTRY